MTTQHKTTVSVESDQPINIVNENPISPYINEFTISIAVELLTVVIVSFFSYCFYKTMKVQKEVRDLLVRGLDTPTDKSRLLKDTLKTTYQILIEILKISQCDSICILELHNGIYKKNYVPDRASVTFEINALGVDEFAPHLIDISLESIRQHLYNALNIDQGFTRIVFSKIRNSRFYVLDAEEVFIFPIGDNIKDGFIVLIYLKDSPCLLRNEVNNCLGNQDDCLICRISQLAKQIKNNYEMI